MKHFNKLLLSVTCLFLVVFCMIALTSCRGKNCSHEWSEWSVKENATCVEEGVQERTCSKCQTTETSAIALGEHDWTGATCTAPKTCKVCSATEGTPSEHNYALETISAEALKSEATCTSKAVYYKSCSCGAISTTDTFEGGELGAHVYDKETVKTEALKSAATCTSKAVYYKSCSCGMISTVDTFESGELLAHVYDKEAVKAEALKSAATCTSKAVYYKSCFCGAISTADTFESGELAAHVYDKEVVSEEALKSAANCAEKAVYYKSCSCGAIGTTDTFTGKELGTHIYDKEIVSEEALKSAATCAEQAVYYKSCFCGVIGTTETFASGSLKAHVYNKEIVKPEALKSAATCTSKAEYYKSCVCGAIGRNAVFVDGDMAAHVYNQEIVKPEALKSAATCTEQAVYYKSCSCSALSATETFETGAYSDEHVYNREIANADTLNTAATCTSKAVYYKSCACGKVSESVEDTFRRGNFAPHVYENEIVKEEALKSAATCQDKAVYYKSCVCGDVSDQAEETFKAGEVADHAYTQETVKDEAKKPGADATCSEQAVYFKSCKDCGAVSTSEAETFKYGETLPHTYTEEIVKPEALKFEATCENAAVYFKSCVCGAVSTSETDIFENGSAAGHSYKEDTSLFKPATCTSAAIKTFVCKNDNCDGSDEEKSYEQPEGSALDHDINGVTPTQVKTEGDESCNCEYVLTYVCQRGDCGETVNGELVYKHEYTASITTPATCKTPGTKTLTCSKCNDCADSVKTETIEPDATGHIWNAGTVADGVRTDTCSVENCGKTKSVTVYEGTKTDSVNASDLGKTEIELNNANINLGNALNGVEEKVVLSADKLEGADRESLGLTPEELAQIGNSPIYNFTITNTTSNEKISQFGDNKVTITLPYTLKTGEDVDSIAVWFIADNGELESIPATYNNGFVTFETNHFSYYTVTKLNPEERCEVYGHDYVSQEVKATCTTDGYTRYACTRCLDTYVDEDSIVKAEGHKYGEGVVGPATCVDFGETTFTCSCGDSYVTKLEPIGHKYVYNEDASKAASCTENGIKAYGCSNEGCNATYTETLPKEAHVYSTTVVPATCETVGYTAYDCDNCDYSYNGNYIAALGHKYEAQAWTWADDYTSASVDCVCANDEEHTLTLDATIVKTEVKGACKNYKKTVYSASAFHEGIAFTDEKSVEVGTPNHVFSDEWKNDGKEHWNECSCGEKTNITKHNYIDGVCDVCRREEKNCDHPEFGYTFILKGNSCTDGYTIIKSCTNCGKVITTNESIVTPGSSHGWYVVFELDPEKHGGCSNHVLSFVRCACGYEAYFRMGANSGFEFDTETGEDVCKTCNMVFKSSIEREYSEEACEGKKYQSSILTLNGKILYQAQIELTVVGHQFSDNEIVVDGEGFIVTSACTKCDKTIVNKVSKEIELEEHDGKYYYDYTFTPDVTDVYTMMANGRRIELYEITGNGEMVMLGTAGSVKICELDAGTSYLYRIGRDALLSRPGTFEMVFFMGVPDDCEHLDYDKYGVLPEGSETCTDGVICFDICKYCGDVEYKGEEYAHIDVSEQIDLSTLGFCGGILDRFYCIACDVVYFMEVMPTCTWTLESNVDGYDVYKCNSCGVIQKTFTVQGTEKDGACWVECESTYIFEKDGKELFVYTSKYSMRQHDYAEEFIMNGDDCTDGFAVKKTCKDCGSTSTSNYTTHTTFEKWNISEEEGVCDHHKLRYLACPCGSEAYFITGGSGEYERDPETGARICRTCGVNYSIKYETSENNGETYEVKIITVKLGETVLYQDRIEYPVANA